MLTEKAKTDFKEWKVNNKNLSTIEVLDFDHLSKISQNALIIEWFDSVNYKISVFFNEYDWNYEIDYEDFISSGRFENSRQEATIQAIIKANDLYNERIK